MNWLIYGCIVYCCVGGCMTGIAMQDNRPDGRSFSKVMWVFGILLWPFILYLGKRRQR